MQFRLQAGSRHAGLAVASAIHFVFYLRDLRKQCVQRLAISKLGRTVMRTKYDGVDGLTTGWNDSLYTKMMTPDLNNTTIKLMDRQPWYLLVDPRVLQQFSNGLYAHF